MMKMIIANPRAPRGRSASRKKATPTRKGSSVAKFVRRRKKRRKASTPKRKRRSYGVARRKTKRRYRRNPSFPKIMGIGVPKINTILFGVAGGMIPSIAVDKFWPAATPQPQGFAGAAVKAGAGLVLAGGLKMTKLLKGDAIAAFALGAVLFPLTQWAAANLEIPGLSGYGAGGGSWTSNASYPDMIAGYESTATPGNIESMGYSEVAGDFASEDYFG